MASDQALQRTMDQVEIRNIISQLAMLTDGGDSDAYALLFTEDARLEMRPEPGQPSVVPPALGREAILAGSKQRRAEGMTGPGTGAVHALQQSMVTVIGDRATAKTYVIIYTNANATPEPMALRVYNDEFVRTSEGWRLAVRYIDPV
jgi:hypothetical protein